jgi:hypothetical protein
VGNYQKLSPTAVTCLLNWSAIQRDQDGYKAVDIAWVTKFRPLFVDETARNEEYLNGLRLSRGMGRVRFRKRRRRKVQIIDLFIQVFFVFAVLTVLSLFFCTLPVWLIVVVVVLLLR